MGKSIKLRAFVITLIFHAGVVLILLYTFLRTPIPPFPSGEGMLVNIGFIDEASGEIQPLSESNIVEPSALNSESKLASEINNVLTQELEEAPEILITQKKETIENESKSLVTESALNTEKKTEEKKIAERIIDPKTLYKGKANNSSSQGISTIGQGDQGSLYGDPSSNIYGEKSYGKGNKGFSYNLTGRKLVKTPPIEDRSQETGKVVVEITVDKDGNVTKATPGARGSTTTSALLYIKARNAALNAKFDASYEESEEQRGTITFVFILE